MGTTLTRSLRAFAVLALLVGPTAAFADVTPAPVVAPVAPPAATTPAQTPTQTTSQPQQTTSQPTSTGPTAAQVAAQKQAAAAAAKAKAEAARKAKIAEAKAKIAAARAKAEAARKAALAAAKHRAQVLAAQKKAAAERARLVAQQQHAEDTAQATFQKVQQRDDAYRFAATAADSIGATAAIDAAPLDGADSKAAPEAFASASSSTPPIPLFAAILAAVALAGAAAYAVRSRAWRVVR
jgi:colicin import membrane protein